MLGERYRVPLSGPLLPNVSSLSLPLSEQWSQSVENFNRMFAVPLTSLFYPAFTVHPKQDQVENELTPIVLKIRRLLREITGQGMDIDIANKIKLIAEGGQQFSRALVAWLSFIDTLLNSANKRYGTTEDQITTREVKAAVRLIYRSRKIDMPHIPNWIEPIIIDLLVSLSVDIIRLAAQRYGLWEMSKPPDISLWRKGLNLFWRYRINLLISAARFFGKVYKWCSDRYWKSVHLSPDVLEAIDLVEKEGLMASIISHSIDAGIDTFVHIFRKYGVLSKESQSKANI
ncbi:hypothetical protein AB835_14565 [Candidatus Endobugula sertula]|uniref:Uncharacterized protein n=1 Tax=Candidatus Endobugula sertula TaxID=62101 RepID=A0A1D2QLC3_9GAMM|nr:hypothetical protein AB835_14565 [Candidatus Endobugula sertula]